MPNWRLKKLCKTCLVGDVQITNQQPKFWVRLVTGWTATAIPLMVLWAIFVFNQTHSFRFPIQHRDLNAFWWMLIIGTGGVFLIAWPVESWWIKPSTSTKRAVGIYALVILAIGAVLALFLSAQDTSESVHYYGHLGLLVAGMVTSVALVVACTGRAIYPILLRHRKTAVAIASLALVIFFLVA